MMAKENKKLIFNITPKKVFSNYGFKYSIYQMKEQKRKKIPKCHREKLLN